MKNILTRQIIFIPVLYAVAKLLWDLIPVELLPEILSGVVSDLFGPSFIMVIILLAFIYIFWRVPILGILAKFLFGTKPNIRGTWAGRLKCDWNDIKIDKPAYLVIEQSNGYSIHIWLFTDERSSSSIFTNIVPYKGGQRIIYTYKNEESPDNKIINPSHEGFCQLDIIDPSNCLEGIYYTDRKTFGKLSFEKKIKKTVKNYKNAQKLFGVKTELP
jgi:hypothetical protein